MTTPIFPSVIGHNLLDGGTDAQDGNSYPGPLLQEYAAAVVGASGYKQNTQSAVSATTAEESLWEVTIPAGMMRENSELVVDWLVSMNNSAGTKTIRMYLGATLIYALAQTTILSFRGRWKLANRGALNSQISGAALALTGYMEGGSGSGVSTFSVDFSQDQVLKITGQKSVSGDSFALEQATVSVR